MDTIQTKYDKFDPDNNKPEKKVHKEPFENLFQQAEDDLELLIEVRLPDILALVLTTPLGATSIREECCLNVPVQSVFPEST